MGYRALALLVLLLILTACGPAQVPSADTIEPNLHIETVTIAVSPSPSVLVLSPTAVPSSTPRPTETPELDPFETAAGEEEPDPLVGPLMLLDTFAGPTDWYLWDIGSDQVRRIDNIINFYHFFEWLDQGCELMVVEFGKDLIVIDTTGQKLRQVFDHEMLPIHEEAEDTWSGSLSSGSHQWIIYYTGRGDYFDTYFGGNFDFEDLHVISTDGTRGPYRLTDNGGAKEAVWSNDGSKIAYAQAWENDRLSIHLFSLDGQEKKKLWELPKGRLLNEFTWSPDDRVILVSHEDETTGDRTLNILDQRGQNILIIDDASAPRWWQDNQTAVVTFRNEERTPGFSYMDITTGEIKRLVPFETPYGEMFWWNPYPDDPLKIGFFLSLDFRDFIVYDVEADQYQVYPTPWYGMELDDWHLGPLAFPGENECGRE